MTVQQPLIAFHGKQSIKEKYLKRLQCHYKQDEIIKGQYWENGKGCAVGCIVETSDNPHLQMQKELGTPVWLNHLLDTLFEHLPNGKSKAYPLRFVSAIKEGTTEEQFTIIKHKFFLYLLEKLCKDTSHETVKESIDLVKSLHQRIIDGDIVTNEEWSAAWSAARSAARSAAWSAAWSAARSAARSAAWSAAGSAAWSAARSAARSAAWSAAWSAARSAAWSAAWSAARSAAWSAAIVEESETLIKILQGGK